MPFIRIPDPYSSRALFYYDPETRTVSIRHKLEQSQVLLDHERGLIVVSGNNRVQLVPMHPHASADERKE